MYTTRDAFKLLHKIDEYTFVLGEKSERGELTSQEYRDYNSLYAELEKFCDRVVRHFEDIESED